MKSKLKVFLAHSFDKTPPKGETIIDQDVVNWFIKLMKKRPLSFDVITGSKPVPGPIDDKVLADISDCSCVIGIFTKRHFDTDNNKWLPPQFVICECASAIGFYYNTNKVICGFCEEGIEPKDLALITISGLELVKFNRNNLENDRDRFIEYLKKIPDIVSSGSYRDGQFVLFKPPYIQQRLYKIYTIYRKGSFTAHNINTMLITDIERFMSEFKGKINHEIWHRRTKIPPLKDMIITHVDKRKDKAFLQGILRSVNQKKINSNLHIVPTKEEEKRAFFSVSFHDKDGNPLKLKNQDIIRYQYAWGLPRAYLTSDDQLDALTGGLETKDGDYCQAEIFAGHGLVQDLVLELRFEKGQGPFFSKSPFFQTTSSFGDLPTWSHSKDLPICEEEDHAMWFETYRLVERNFNGKIRVMWRPIGSSKKKIS